MKFEAQCQTYHLFVDVIYDPGASLAAVLGEQAHYVADSVRIVDGVDPSAEITLALHLII